MRFSVTVSLILLALLALPAFAGSDKDQGWAPTPLMRSVEPDQAKIGDVVTINGDFLDKKRVAEFYLTDGKDNFKLEVVEQTDKVVKVKIVKNTPFARLRLMVLTTGSAPQFIEQPVMVEVIAPTS
jgi:hypothetical protein